MIMLHIRSVWSNEQIEEGSKNNNIEPLPVYRWYNIIFYYLYPPIVSVYHMTY